MLMGEKNRFFPLLASPIILYRSTAKALVDLLNSSGDASAATNSQNRIQSHGIIGGCIFPTVNVLNHECVLLSVLRSTEIILPRRYNLYIMHIILFRINSWKGMKDLADRTQKETAKFWLNINPEKTNNNNNNNNNFRVSNIRVSNRTLIYKVCPEAALTS